MARPSAAHEAGKAEPASPPPVTHSWTKKVRAVSRAMAKIPFQVIPVLDILNGQAVHAVGGRRAHYQPIQSILHASSEPIPLARALRDSLGLQTLYLADLDAIGGRPPRLDIYREIINSNIHIWIDAGVRDVGSIGSSARTRSFV